MAQKLFIFRLSFSNEQLNTIETIFKEKVTQKNGCTLSVISELDSCSFSLLAVARGDLASGCLFLGLLIAKTLLQNNIDPLPFDIT